MSFGSILITNKGLLLQAKAQTGTKLNFTKIIIGNGKLAGQAIQELNNLVSPKKTLPLVHLNVNNDGTATVGAILSNQDISTGFYWREVGLFATDPDNADREILYCYGNAGDLADYIPAGGGSEILEKRININTVIANATNVSATINSSLVYATPEDIAAHNLNQLSHEDIRKQITVCNGEIEKVRGEIETAIGGIDLSSVNVHTTAVANDVVKPHIDIRTTEINNHVSNMGASTVETINNNTNTVVDYAKNVVVNHINGKHNETNTHITSQADRVIGQINAKPSGAVKSVQRGIGIAPDKLSSESIGSYSTSYVDVTINSVNVNKTQVTAYSQSDLGGMARLLNSTTLRIYPVQYRTHFAWEVVEFY